MINRETTNLWSAGSGWRDRRKSLTPLLAGGAAAAEELVTAQLPEDKQTW
jgi:hypothetical protein